MKELARLSGIFALLFAGSLSFAYLLTLLGRPFRRVPVPIDNGQLRIRSGAAMYRARFLGETAEGWTFSAPLQRDAYVPLRVGEDLIIEAPSERGLLRFRTTIVGRLHDTAVMIARRPSQVHVEERRGEGRRRDLAADVRLDGMGAELSDISGTGARISTDRAVSPGDRVRVDLPWESQPRYACVLDAERCSGSLLTRLRFEEPLKLPPLK